LAETVRSESPGVDDGSWQGHGSFKALIATLAISGLKFSAVPPGYAYLEGVHHAPSAAVPADAAAIPVALRPALEELHRQTGAPLLATEKYRAVFEALSDEVQERPFDLAEVSKAIRDRLLTAGSRVGRTAINFIVKGIHFGGHRYDPDLPQDPKALAAAFVRNLRNSVEPTPPLEGEELSEALAYCSGALLSVVEAAQVGSGVAIVEAGRPAVENARLGGASPEEIRRAEEVAGLRIGTDAEQADRAGVASPRS
jgi:hypothetical protein